MDGPHGNASGPGDVIAQAVNDGFADGGQVDAVLHDDVQLDGDGVILVVGDADALAHGFPPQQVDEPVRHRAEGHALDAIAVGGGAAGDGGEHLAADADLAQIVLQFHRSIPSFR